LAKEQLRTLGRLRKLPHVEDFYLAGASAIAWHLGHRRSLDLDLFSFGRRAPLRKIQREAAAIRGARVLETSDATVAILVGGVPVDFVEYPYPLLEEAVPGPGAFPVAGLLVLATMKLSAIARRGIKRDFWDLYEIARAGISLRQASEAYERRFGRTEADLYHVQRSLTWFEDAQKDPRSPIGLTPALWKRVRAFFQQEAPCLLDPSI
jgi:hypothetical protein